ncbi:MAG: hypothetical protein GC150_12920 [Rhizobiales bacterium]|nr:hypothetical protein [Hyphomicrobiales bacterium]
MRKALVSGAILASMAGVGAYVALAADQDIDVSATVDGFCTYTNASLVVTGNMTAGPITTSSASFTIDSPVNALGQINPANFIITLQTTCNKAADATLTTTNGGLKDTTVPITTIDPGSAAAFRDLINYTATLNGPAGIFTTLNTNGTSGASASDASTGAFTGNLSVSLTIVSTPTEIVTAGDYADTLTVSVTPQ